VIVLDALAVPVSKPISPPRNVPPIENRMKVAASPHLEGESLADMSGIGSTYDQYRNRISPQLRLRIKHTGSTISKSHLYGLLHCSEGIEICQAHCAKSESEVEPESKTSNRCDSRMRRDFAACALQ
jgi:hypothetical protein